MKKLSLLFVGLFCSQILFAQINIASLHNQNADAENSFLNPSMIGNEYKNFKISFLPFYANFGNNFTSAGDVINYVKEFNKKTDSIQVNTSTVNGIMNNLKKTNLIYAGADVTMFNVGFNIHRKRKVFLEFQLSARQHIHANISLPKELFYLFYKGNKYYENQSIDILPKINALQYADYGINVAKNFHLKLNQKTNLIIKPAVRFRYLVGTANVNTQNSKLDFYTCPDGRYIEASLNGQVLQSYISEKTFSNLNTNSISSLITKGAGTGFGVDFGVSAKMNDQISASVSMVDNGSIQFNENAYTISSKYAYRWEGYDWNKNIDSFIIKKDMLNLDSTAGAYKVNIGSKLMISGSYGFGKKASFKRYLNHYHHTVSLFYVQGFQNYLNATKSPMLSLGYSYRLKNILNAGVNASLGGLTRGSLGAHVHFGLGPMQFGFATNSLGYLVSKYNTRGVDLQFYSAFNF
jgi:hypothetical protein